MNITTNFLSGKTAETLNTEILFAIVSAKSVGKDVVKLSLRCEAGESQEIIARRLSAVTKILKSAKKSKLIQLFIYSSDFDKESTELEYMKNKYSELLLKKDVEDYILLKI